jgi:DNA (cytosine-5)-methyltransferase 1
MNTIALKNNAPNHKTLVSLFAGCGGSSLGYKAIGFDIRLAVEWDKGAASIYRDNFPETTLHEGDINKMDVSEALRLTELKQGELDVLDGSPPCQGFSRDGSRRFADPRNTLFHEYVRLLQGMMPKAFIMENVAGLAQGKMKILFSEMTRALQDTGYKVACRKLNAWWYRVPQSRERLIWVGIRDDIKGEPSHPQPMLRQPISVYQSFGASLVNVSPSQTHNDWSPVAMTLRASTLPQRTVSEPHSVPNNAVRKLADGTATRPITIEEAKVLQSFPPWFRIQQYKYLGNSVPPLMAQAVGEHVAGILDGADAN